MKQLRKYQPAVRTAATGLAFGFFPLLALAGETPAKATGGQSGFDNPVFVGMLCTVIFLCIAIVVLAKVTKTAIILGMNRKKNDQSSTMLKSLLILATLGISAHGFSQADTAVVASAGGSSSYWGMSATTFFTLLSVILIELFTVWQLYTISMRHLGYYERKERLRAAKAAMAKVKKKKSFLEKMNKSVEIEKEADIMLDHNYDGIRELDNNLPPWWKYGFYMSIVFAVIYLFRFHVVHTGKLQQAEYDQEMATAKYEMALYRKKAANLVDETNATLLTDAASLASGKTLFENNCAACHGMAGEGNVGPNLTDDYWLHGGDIKDVFKTIKYGYAEKGMKSWQQDLGARQIHEVASYIKSIHGSNPPNAKEPQGELELAAPVTDTLNKNQ